MSATSNVVPLNSNRDARVIDEMALTLLGVAELSADAACIMALFDAGFRGKDIGQHLDTARDLARARLKR